MSPTPRKPSLEFVVVRDPPSLEEGLSAKSWDLRAGSMTIGRRKSCAALSRMSTHRKQVSARLDSLFGKDRAQDDTAAMKRLSVPSARPSHFSAPSSPLPRPQILEPEPQTTSPILRWFRSSAEPSRASSPSSALSEALHDESLKLPSRPEAAVLSSSFKPHIRPPPLLGNLTRSTLPTSSLSPPVQSTERSPDHASHFTVDSAYPVALNHSPPSIPTRTSIDTLRNVQRRTSSKKPPSPGHQQTRSLNISAPLMSWWSSDPPPEKKHEGILDEEDQADNSDEERENIRHKCRFSSLYHQHRTKLCRRYYTREPYCVLSRTPWV